MGISNKVETVRKAAFLDRDGVINQETGYVHRPQDFIFLPGIFAACRILNQKNFEIVIITNQAGIARGYYSEQDFQQLTQWMLAEFAKQHVRILDVRYCPYHPTEGIGAYKRDSIHRKPGPQMILDAAAEFNIDRAASFIAGDKDSDIQAGIAAGLGSAFLIESPHTPQHAMPDVPVYPSLLALVQDRFAV